MRPDARAGSQSGRPNVRRLGPLLARCGISVDPATGDIEITSVAYDSRTVEPGGLFVAIRGFTADGHAYVGEAARRGAVAALVEARTETSGLVEIVVPDTRAALGPVSHEFAGRPSDHLTTHAVTGTNGKTTTTYLIDSILRQSGMKTGVIGTLGYRVDERHVAGHMTSPEALDVAKLMASMVESGVETVAMEVSSHALSLKRALGIRFDTATLTNLSRDHLDFHGSIEEYAAAKRTLFELLEGDAWKEGSTAVVNTDDEFGRELAASVAASGAVRLLTYGMREGDVRSSSVSSSPEGTDSGFETPAGSFDVRLKLVGNFNVMNALAATAVAVSQNVSVDAIVAGLAAVGRVDGRLEPIASGQEFAIFVDYAHTPDALEKVLDTLRGLEGRRLITVFGCGGDRDKGKRPMMGEIAARLSDVVVVTSDNPRTEAPGAITKEILSGVEEGAAIEVIEDRREAIRRAVEMAAPGDIVLIAGKGHEDYQIVGSEKRHFDDREEARAAVARLLSARGAHGSGSSS